MSEHKSKADRFWSVVAGLLRTPTVILFVGAVAAMIFGGNKGLIVGCFILWFLASVLVPAVWGESLERRFGTTLGMVIAFAPLWVPGLTALLLLGFRK